MNYIKKILKNKKILFCYILLVLSIFLTIVIIIAKPKKIKPYYPYSYSETELKEINFPIVQHVHNKEDFLNSIYIYLRDKSINNYDFKIQLYGENTKKTYYDKEFHNNKTDIIVVEAQGIKADEEKNFILKIDCENCHNVVVSKKKSLNHKSDYIEGSTDNEILEISLINYVINNSYYWYTIFGLVIVIILYPLAKEESPNEK